MIVLHLSCRPEALEKLLLFVKRFRTEKAPPRTQSHFTIMVVLWGWTDEESRFRGMSLVTSGHRELVAGMRLS